MPQRAMSVMERTFGVLKERFPIISYYAYVFIVHRAICLTKADRCNRLNNWLEALPQAEKSIDIPSNAVSASTPAVEDVLAHLAMDSIEYQELRIATVLGDLGVHFVSVSSAQMDELFSASPSVITTSTQDKGVNHRLNCSTLSRSHGKNSEWRQRDNLSQLSSR
ncbi:uncharacterized protein IAS62_004949 [Cryptococcus decagattii]|uniref:Uncharacterized protein n=1 Tax=Cryptococcus decagattii TaxID=1859122 RepID=A0ABZ2B0F2_9TREE